MNKAALIQSLARQLGLGHLANRKQYEFFEQQPGEDFLLHCLQEEIGYREQKAKERRIKQAQIPTCKDFESFDTDFQKGITDWQLEQRGMSGASCKWFESPKVCAY